jgi:hypothetical protein
VDHAALAKALGVSVASIRQARLDPKAIAHRAPPLGWENAVAGLARQRIARYEQLLSKISRIGSTIGHEKRI